MYVDGSLRQAAGAIAIIDPATEEPWGEASAGSVADVDVAVRSAHAALPAWSATSLDERVRIMLRLRDELRARVDEFAELATHEMGAPITVTRTLGASPALIDAYIDAARELAFAYVRGDTLIRRRPIGVVAGVIPWNTPIRSAVKKAVPALLAGCAVVLKPAPETPFDSLLFAACASRAGLPPGVLNVVPGGGETGEALATHPLVRKVAFTGSTRTGARLAEVCGPDFKRLQLELGGKSAAVVLEDADVEVAVAAVARSAFRNTGQTCVALTRMLVPHALHHEVVAGLCAAAGEYVIGDPFDEATTMGPLVAERQRERVLGYLASAREEGATVACGGGRPELERGWYVEPTVLTGVTNTMRVAREEIFGPVLCVIGYGSDDAAVGLANDTPYGLHGAVFGEPVHALAVAQRLDTGSVSINDEKIPISAPFGGVKASGIGREHGPEGYDHFLEYASYALPPGAADTLGLETYAP
jgi:betaine-aldehyde dehydrogenase